MEALAWMSLPIDKLAQDIFNLPPGEEKERLVGYLKEMFHPFHDLTGEVVSQYNELDPLGAGEDWYFSLKQKYETAEFPARKLSEEDKASAESAGIEAAAEIEKERKPSDKE